MRNIHSISPLFRHPQQGLQADLAKLRKKGDYYDTKKERLQFAGTQLKPESLELLEKI